LEGGGGGNAVNQEKGVSNFGAGGKKERNVTFPETNFLGSFRYIVRREEARW